MNPSCPNCKATFSVNRYGLGRFECTNCGTHFNRAAPMARNAEAVETGWINIILSVN